MIATRARELIVVTKRYDASCAAFAAMASRGWRIHFVETPAKVARILSQSNRKALAGLVDLTDPQGTVDYARYVQDLPRERMGWVAAIDPGQLEIKDVRHLIRDVCFDFITVPCPETTIESVLGHALGVASLHSESTRHVVQDEQAFGGMIGDSPEMRALYKLIRRAAPSLAPVYIAGETGTGKELAAAAIHHLSHRSAFPFVAINCGAIPQHLMQSELFGYERGAFTGAQQRKLGRFELANKGTLFLDEIGDLPLDSQASLLRFLQEGIIERLGGTDAIRVDVRVVSATHHDLEAAVAAGRFRADLYHRLCVIRLKQPPLRSRGDDIEQLAQHALKLYNGTGQTQMKGFSNCALKAMQTYTWPGNVRELLNRVHQAVVMAEGRYITSKDLGIDASEAGPVQTLAAARDAAEVLAINAALRRNLYRVGHCAKELGISRITLYRLMKQHGLRAEALERTAEVG